MSHFSVLVVGECPEEQLEPFWELDLSEEELANDPRAIFDEEVAQSDLKKEAKRLYENALKYKRKDTIELYKEKKYKEMLSEEYQYNKETKSWGYYSNPNAEWDWYSIGGRWKGYFKLKKGKKGELGEAGVFNNKPIFDADQAYKKDIDFEGMKDMFGKRAEKQYDMIKKYFGGKIPKLDYTWDEVEKNKKLKTIEEKRDFYYSQPLLVKVERERKKYYNKKDKDKTEVENLIFSFGFNFEEYQCTKEEFKNKARECAIPTFAVLKDGEWLGRGSMGWFGCVSEEKEQMSWNKEFNEILNSVREDELLTIVDCHI